MDFPPQAHDEDRLRRSTHREDWADGSNRALLPRSLESLPSLPMFRHAEAECCQREWSRLLQGSSVFSADLHQRHSGTNCHLAERF